MWTPWGWINADLPTICPSHRTLRHAAVTVGMEPLRMNELRMTPRGDLARFIASHYDEPTGRIWVMAEVAAGQRPRVFSPVEWQAMPKVPTEAKAPPISVDADV